MTMNNITYRSGLSHARSPVVDGWLEDSENDKLYERWKPEWPIDEFGGGITGITMSHVREVGFKKLSRRFGPKFAKKLLEIADNEDEA